MSQLNIPLQIGNRAAAFAAALWFRLPSRKLTLIGVTGAVGREQTAEYIYSILRQTKRDVGIITRQRQAINDEPVNSRLRINIERPSPFRLQRLIRELVYRGCEYGILEVPAKALAERRICGTRFKIAVLTCSVPHKKDFNSQEEYLYSKCRLFRRTSQVVLNKDDKAYAFLARISQGQRISYGINNESQIKALKIQTGDWGTFFYFINKKSVWQNQLSFDRSIKLKQQNINLIPCALAAIGAAATLNIPEFRIKKGLEEAREVLSD